MTITATPGRLAVSTDSFGAGPVTLLLQNRTGGVVSAQLLAVRDDHTLEEAATYLTRGQGLPEWIVTAGGVAPVAPGRSAGVTHSLPAGRYLIASTVNDSARVPQYRRGYLASFRTTGEGSLATVRGIVGVLAVGNASFRFRRVADSNGVVTEMLQRARGLPLVHGDRIIEVETAGGVAHEIALVRMDLTATLRQYTQWLDGGQRGAGPGLPSGGIGIIPGGRRLWLRVRLDPGTYWFYCSAVHRGGRRGYETGEYAQIAVR